MSCLGRVGCALLLVTLGAGLVLGWQNRERVERWLGRQSVGPLPTIGRPTEDALVRARDRVDSLNGWRADSVLLLADEAAALLAAGLDRRSIELDSLEVELDSGRVVIRGVIPVSGLPEDVLGPVQDLVGSSVDVALGGPLQFERPGRGRWRVDRARLGSLPLPMPLTRRLLERVLPGVGEAGLPVRLPEGVTDVALVPGALILYGGGGDGPQ